MQNLVSLNFSNEDLAAVDEAIAALKRVFAPLIALQPQEIRGLAKMGEKSEVFCRQTLTVLAANPQIVPPNLGLAEAAADLAALDAPRPRLVQLQQLTERAQDTEIALGADIMSVATEGYALLKVSGKDEGLKAARPSWAAAGPRTAAAAMPHRPRPRPAAASPNASAREPPRGVVDQSPAAGRRVSGTGPGAWTVFHPPGFSCPVTQISDTNEYLSLNGVRKSLNRMCRPHSGTWPPINAVCPALNRIYPPHSRVCPAHSVT